MRDETNLSHNGVIFEGTADISSVCYCYKKSSQELGASINLALWLTSDLIFKKYHIKTLCNHETINKLFYQKKLYLRF